MRRAFASTVKTIRFDLGVTFRALQSRVEAIEDTLSLLSIPGHDAKGVAIPQRSSSPSRSPAASWSLLDELTRAAESGLLFEIVTPTASNNFDASGGGADDVGQSAVARADEGTAADSERIPSPPLAPDVADNYVAAPGVKDTGRSGGLEECANDGNDALQCLNAEQSRLVGPPRGLCDENRVLHGQEGIGITASLSKILISDENGPQPAAAASHAATASLERAGTTGVGESAGPAQLQASCSPAAEFPLSACLVAPPAAATSTGTGGLPAADGQDSAAASTSPTSPHRAGREAHVHGSANHPSHLASSDAEAAGLSGAGCALGTNADGDLSVLPAAASELPGAVGGPPDWPVVASEASSGDGSSRRPGQRQATDEVRVSDGRALFCGLRSSMRVAGLAPHKSRPRLHTREYFRALG